MESKVIGVTNEKPKTVAQLMADEEFAELWRKYRNLHQNILGFEPAYLPRDVDSKWLKENIDALNHYYDIGGNCHDQALKVERNKSGELAKAKAKTTLKKKDPLAPKKTTIRKPKESNPFVDETK